MSEGQNLRKKCATQGEKGRQAVHSHLKNFSSINNCLPLITLAISGAAVIIHPAARWWADQLSNYPRLIVDGLIFLWAYAFLSWARSFTAHLHFRIAESILRPSSSFVLMSARDEGRAGERVGTTIAKGLFMIFCQPFSFHSIQLCPPRRRPASPYIYKKTF